MFFSLLFIPSFFAFVSPDSVHSFSTWNSTVCLLVCSSPPFPFISPPMCIGSSRAAISIRSYFIFPAPLDEVNFQQTLKEIKKDMEIWPTLKTRLHIAWLSWHARWLLREGCAITSASLYC